MIAAILASVAQQHDSTPHSDVTLVAAGTYVPGEPLSAAVRIRLDEGWHTYWRNPGETGTPTRVEWRLPPGWSITEERWSVPRRFADSGSTSIGYASEAWISAQIQTARGQVGPQTLSAKVEYLVCADSCLPGEADVALTMTIGSDAEKPASNAPGVFPREADAVGEWWREGGQILLRCPAIEGADPEEVELFAESPGLVDPSAAPFRAESAGNLFSFTLAPAGFPDPKLAQVAFVMVPRDRPAHAVRFTARPRPASRTHRDQQP